MLGDIRGGPAPGSMAAAFDRSAQAFRGAVSTGHPLATDTALDVLRSGGNAADAALAAAAVQCVVEMPWCGVGGDAFLLVYTPSDGVVALNGSGAAPMAVDRAFAGAERAPRFGPRSVAVPGFADAWEQLATRFGTRSLGSLLEPAIGFATEGIEVGERLSAAIRRVGPELPDYPALAAILARPLADATAPLTQPDLARTLEVIGREGARSLYEGELADKISTEIAARGGLLSELDLASHHALWEPPLRTSYRGYEVATSPPVSISAALLMQLRIFEGFDISDYRLGSAQLVDLMVRCKLAAFTDVLACIGDPAHVSVPVDWLLSEDRINYWRSRIQEEVRGAEPPPTRVSATPDGTDTTSLVVSDAAGMTVVFIHSLFNEFGSREIVPGTGLLLNDRLANLPVGTDQAQGLVGGRRPVHTLNPYLVMEAGVPVLAGATPGGRGQVQTNFQVISNVLDFELDVQSALDEPRWLCGAPRTPGEDDVVHLESSFKDGVDTALSARGMQVRRIDADGTDLFGNCTVIGRDLKRGTYEPAADNRRGGQAGSC